MGDWNAILDHNIDKAGRAASGSDRCESRRIDLMVQHVLVDKFRLDHPGREMWMWLDSSPSVCIRTYLDRVLVRKTDTEFVRCPTFHWIEQTNPKLVRASLRLANRPNLAGYWKFNTSLLEIGVFRQQLGNLIQREIVGAVTGNKWWVSLKYRIRDFTIKYGKQFNLARAKKVKSLDDRLSWAVERGDSIAVDLAKRDLEREPSEHYKIFVVRSRLKRK